MLGQVRAEIADGQRDGWPVVRIAGDMTWAQGTVTPDELAGYEARINTVLADGDALGICLYDRSRFSSPVLSAASSVHPGTILPELDDRDPLLRMRSKPGGLRLTGEVDLSNVAAFDAVLAHVRERTEAARPIEIDATGLVYIDLAAIRVLSEAAHSHSAGLVVRGANPMLIELIELCRTDPLSRLLVHPAPGGDRAKEVS
jgi:anti-anti-sigma factor